MSGLLSVASGALRANQTVLQTTGNNIANVNTPGYSRQTVVLTNVAGQFSGSGYYGQGVSVATIERKDPATERASPSMKKYIDRPGQRRTTVS